MSLDPRLEMWNNEDSKYREKPMHILSQAETNAVIMIHITSKQKYQSYMLRLKLSEKENVKQTIQRMLELCDYHNEEL